MLERDSIPLLIYKYTRNIIFHVKKLTSFSNIIYIARKLSLSEYKTNICLTSEEKHTRKHVHIDLAIFLHIVCHNIKISKDRRNLSLIVKVYCIHYSILKSIIQKQDLGHYIESTLRPTSVNHVCRNGKQDSFDTYRCSISVAK